MQQQILSPGMQNAEHADLGTQMLGIARHLEGRLCAGRKQQIVKQARVFQRQHVEFVRHGEDHVKVTSGQQFLFARGEPALAGLGLALRAMPVTAGVIGDGSVDDRSVSGHTRDTHPDGRPAPAVRQLLDGAERFQLLIAETRSIALQKTIALRVKDIGHLHGGPVHVSFVRLKP